MGKMNTHNYLLRTQGETPITDAEIKSAMKRINDKIYQLDKAGMSNSVAMNRYKEFAEKYGGIQTTKPTKRSKSGTGRPTIKLGALDKLDKKARKEILSIDRHGGSMGEEKKKAINYLRLEHNDEKYKPSKQEISETSNKLGEIHQFIEDNDNIIYDVEDATNDFIRGNNGRLTPAEVDRLYHIMTEWEELNEQKKLGQYKMAKDKQVTANKKKWKNRKWVR